MEIIKKTIKKNETAIGYSIPLLLTCNVKDLGFFEAIEDDKSTLIKNEVITTTVTGFTESRLDELRTYSQSSDLNKKYILSSSYEIDGLDLSETNLSAGTYTYYIGTITYVDRIIDNTSITTFSFTSSATTSPDFVNLPLIKDESKLDITLKPKIDNDLFIVRQTIPVFENNYRLSGINNLFELTYYGGSYFNIVKNS